MVKEAKKALDAVVGTSKSKRWTIGGQDLAELGRLALIAALIAVASAFTDNDNATVAAIAVVVVDALRRWTADEEL